jgi:molybdenum cofactor biosynthesis enzyme MoaA
MDTQQLTDKSNRVINYLRLSITDRCNLRCRYCMPEEGIHFVPHSEILFFVFKRVITGQNIASLKGGEV